MIDKDDFVGVETEQFSVIEKTFNNLFADIGFSCQKPKIITVVSTDKGVLVVFPVQFEDYI